MATDIVFPKDNEKEFIRIAEKLGISRLIFIYPFKKIPKDIPSSDKTEIIAAEEISLKDLPKLHDRKGLIIAKATGSDRQLFESKNIDIIYGLETVTKKDFIHHKASGMNHVMAKLAEEKSIAIGFSISEIIRSDRKKKSIIMGRIMQNIRFCRKYGAKTISASFAKTPMQMRSPKDIQVFMQTLGMDTKDAKKSTEFSQ